MYAFLSSLAVMFLEFVPVSVLKSVTSWVVPVTGWR